MLKIVVLIFILVNEAMSRSQVAKVDESAHKEINLKLTTNNAITKAKPIKPDIIDLDPNDFNKKAKFKRIELKHIDPSIDLIEKRIHIQTLPTVNTSIARHDIEPRVVDLENMLSINISTKSVQVPIDQLFGEQFHDQIIGFHGAVLNVSNFNSSKPADLDDYAKWIELEKNLSKLNRFKKLHEEISDFEKKLETRHDDSEDLIVIDRRKLSKKLELAIKQIENNERKLKRSDL